MAKINQDLFKVEITSHSYVISYDGREVMSMHFMKHDGGKKSQTRLAVHELAEQKIAEFATGKGHPDMMAIIYNTKKEVAHAENQ